jgi:flagellar biosynthesis/type III secretory pathway chaperone
MKKCDLPDITKMLERHLMKGIDIELAERVVRAELRAFGASVSEADLKKLFPTPTVRELTEDEKADLGALWTKVASALSNEFIEKLTTEDVSAVFTDILKEDSNKFFGLLETAGLDLKNFQLVQYRHINRLKELIEIHTTLGNSPIIEELEAVLEKEEQKLEKRKLNKDKLDEVFRGKEVKSALIKTLLKIADIVDTRIITEEEKVFMGELNDEIEKVREQVEKVRILRQQVDRAYTAWKAADPSKKSKLREAYYKIKKENTPKIKEESKKAAKMHQAASKKKTDFISRELKDKAGVSLKLRDKTLTEAIERLEKELVKTQDEMVSLTLRTLAQDTRDVLRSTSQIIAFQGRMRTIANAGAQMRVDALSSRLGTLDAPTLEEFKETFGDIAYKATIGAREKIELPDKTKIDDPAPPSLEEIKKAGEIWKMNMMDTAYSGFYSEDPADITEESLNLIESIALGKTIVDSSSPEAVDPTFSPINTSEQRLAQATPGEIPVANQFTNPEEATRAIESTIRRLYSVFGFKHFKGTIPEKLIRQILHPQLMDINPKAWANARVTRLKPRQLGSIQTSDQVSFRRSVILAHGGNPDLMPEFTDPNWASDNSKLISFDIETFGDITHPEDKVDGVYAVQIKIKDGLNPPQTKLLVNGIDADGNEVLVDAKSTTVTLRKPISQKQLTAFLKDIEDFQNKGFKVITHNGNNFDFPQLRKHVTDTDLLARVALRSLDMLANITEAVPGDSWKAKQRVKGKKLKELAKANLPTKSPISAYGGRIQFTSGYPIDTTRGNTEIKLDSNGIKPLWDEAQTTGDWYRFDAYSENDADLTIDLYEQIVSSSTGELNLVSEDGSASIINLGRPLSNLFLNNDNTHIQTSMYRDSLGDIARITDKINNIVDSAFYTEEQGYDAHRVLDIFHQWWIKSLLADPKRNALKIEQLTAGLKKKAQEETEFDLLHIKVANENRQAITSILQDKFKRFGYVLNLDYSTEGLNRNVAIENVDVDGNPIITFNEEGLYTKRVNSAETYKNAVLDSFLKTIKDPDIKNRFQLALRDRVDARKRTDEESDTEYWESVINNYLKKLIPGFTNLAQFGNAELDWKPADEVGIAIAQVMMDQKPGITVTDVLIHKGNETQYVLTLDAQSQWNSQSGAGRRKQLVVLKPTDIHMAQPHTLVKEEKAYEGFRLLQRINYLLDLDIDFSMKTKLLDWLNTGIKQGSQDPISFFASEQVLATMPDVANRGAFTAIPSLKRRMQTTYEQLYEVPRLLMSINHDCFYIGINQPQRFLREDLPVFYFDDAVNPGGPTAATLMGGALDQLAWMMNFGMLSDAEFDQIWASVERGIELLRKEGVDKDGRPLALLRGNKADYAFQGKHNILAMLLTMGGYRDKDGNPVNITDEILTRLGALDETGKPATTDSNRIIVNKKDLGDPRYKVYDLLFGFKEIDETGTSVDREGLFTQMLNNPKLFDLNEEETALLVSVSDKLQKIGPTVQIKEFFKGAVTPRMYQAGYPGVLMGLTLRNEKEDIGLTDDELQFLATQLLRANSIAQMNVIDAALGYSSTDIKVIKDLLLQFKQRQNKDSLAAYIGPRATKKAKDKETRLNSMKAWFAKSVELTVENLARFERISPTDPVKMTKFVKETKERLLSEWTGRLENAAEVWNTTAVEDMSVEEYHNFIYDMNIALAGGEEPMKDHLMLFGLRQRAATPYTLDPEAIRLQQLVSTPHISTEDFKRWLNKEIYFRYGIEAASGRNHMVGWWGVGPQGSKFAQPRVIEGEPGDINQYGIWRIEDLSPKTVTEFETAFLRSIMIDLSRFYAPPQDITGYSLDTENRSNYFKAVEERSAREIESTELSKLYDTMEDSEIIYDKDGLKITSKERKQKNKKISGSVVQRARMRTKLTGKESSPIDLDLRSEGIGALRPSYADIDFTQRGIYALTEAQHRSRVLNNESIALQIQLGTPTSENPNGFVDQSLRGYVSPWGKDNMPYVPQSAEDISAVVALGSQSGIQMKAIQLQNLLVEFAMSNGLESLVKNKDWTRIYVIKRLREKAMVPAIQSLQKMKKSSPTTSAFDREIPIREARVRFHDGIIKVAGLSSISLSGIKRFSVIDLMAGLDERSLSLEEISDIKKQYGEEPGWLQVLTWLSTKGKVERLMPLQFGITIDPGVIARGQEGRKGIPSTTQMPVTSFGREIIQVYHIIQNTDIARRITTRMIKGTKLETNAKFDQNGFVIIESLDPMADKALYQKIWNEILAHKKQLTKEMMTKFNFVLDRSHVLQIQTKKPITVENETEESLTLQSFTDASAFTQSLVDNPSTLWLFTPEMITQLLNNITNYRFIVDLELSLQVNKEMFQVPSNLDIMVQEEQAQLFEKLREDEEDVNDALLFLHKTDPGSKKPLAISDFRKVDNNNIPRQVLDFGGYMINEAYFRGSQTKDIAEKATNMVKVSLFIPDAKNTKRIEKQVSFPTADMPFITTLVQVMNKGRALGFHEQADQIADFLFLYSRTNKEVTDIESVVKKTFKGVTTSNAVLKLAAMSFELSGNPEAQESLYRYFNFTKPSEVETLKTKVNSIVDAMMFITSTQRHEVDPVYYLAKARMERQPNVSLSLATDPSFLSHMSSLTGLPTSSAMSQSVKKAVEEVIQPILEPDIASELYATTASPTVFADPDDFILSFADPGEREIASKVVAFLDNLVAKGIISSRVRDMKLMLIGKLSQTNPSFIRDFGFTDTSDESETLMSAAKKNGKYIIGLNIKMAEQTPENELLFSFAEELIHIARLKYVRNDSTEWNNIVGLFSANRSRGMIKELLIAFNQGKSYEDLEARVNYAMENPDEFFAHFGAFVLLKDVLGNEETLSKLEARFKDVRTATSLWKRAFYKIKSMAKDILVTFAKLQNDPVYSDLYKEAESAVMAVIGNSHTSRIDVGNPDATFNTYKTAATTLHNKVVRPAERVRINILQQEMRRLDIDIKNERTRKNTETDPVVIATIDSNIKTMDSDLQKARAELKTLDAITFMGIAQSEVEKEIIDLTAWHNKNKRRITERTLLNQGKRRAFLSHFVTKGMEQRGERVDTPYTLAHLFRNRLFAGSGERLVNGFIQNGALNSFNAINLTWNSPFAPMMVLSDLIDKTAATTSGSLTSDVGGIENRKYQIDIYAHNVLRMWGEISSEYPKENEQLDIVKQVVAFVSAGVVPSGPDKMKNSYIENLGNAIKLMRDNMVALMNKSQMLQPGEDLTVDKFPLKLRNFSLLDETQRENAFTIIKEALLKKNIDEVKLKRENASVSTLLLYTTGALPYMKPGEELSNKDTNIIQRIAVNIKNGTPTKATTAREAIIDYYMRKIAADLVRDGVIPSTALYAEYTPSAIMKDINEEIDKLGYLNREGNLSFAKAFSGMNPDNLSVVVTEYETNLSLVTTDIEVAERFKSIRTNPDAASVFNIPSQTIPIVPKEFAEMGTGDILTIDFLSKMGVSSHLFRNNSFHLNSSDIFLNGSPALQNLFDWHVDSLFKSLARGTGYDLVERIMVQEVSGIPGAYFNIEQILQMFESEVGNEHVQSENFYLLDSSGNEKEVDKSRNLMLASIKRLRDALRESRGTLSQDDLTMGTATAKLNSIGRDLVSLKYGPNIPFATALVEAPNAVLATMTGSDNILNSFLNAILISGIIGESAIKNLAWNLRDKLPKLEEGGPTFKIDIRKGKFFGFKFSPLRTRKLPKLAASALWTTEEALSPMLPYNVNHSAGTSELVEKMSWWERSMLRRKRSSSGMMQSVRTAAGAIANRNIVNLARNGKLLRLRDEYQKSKPRTVVGIMEVARKAKVNLDQEVLISIVRSGLLEGNVVEAIALGYQTFGTFRGTLLDQNMAGWETDLHLGRTSVPVLPKKGIKQTEDAVRAARIAMAKFLDLDINRSMVVRKSMDAPVSSDLASNVLSFFKSYPALYVAQQLIRRGSVASPFKLGLSLFLTGLLDLIYNLVLALARGTFSYDDVLQMIQNKKKTKVSDLTRMVLRHPIFSNNTLGLAANASQLALTGQGSNVISSVAEGAFNTGIKDIYKFGHDFYKQPTRWDKNISNAYKAFGFILPEEMYSIPVRLMVQQAFGEASPYNTPGNKPSPFGVVMNQAENYYDGVAKETTRALFSGYDNMPKPGMLDRAKNLKPDQFKYLMPKPKLPTVPQPKPQETPQPTPSMSTSVKVPTLQQQATTPIKAPM